MIGTLGKRIAQARRELAARKQRDVTRNEIAEAVGVDPSTVSLWEADTKVPREKALVALAAYLGVTPAYLRYGIEPSRSYGLVAEPEPVAKPAPAKKAARKRGGTK